MARVGSFRYIWKQGRLAVRLLRDRRVPAWPKALLALPLAYLLAPVDLLPDLALPGLGYVDDLLLLLLALRAFIAVCPSRLVQELREN
ncbi:MAG: DUF1232 domain-containing protein [Nitrospinota bacterium]